MAFDTSKGGQGPTGGSGGRGGDVYFEGITDLGALRQFRHQKKFSADGGLNGKDKNLDGRNGKDLVLKAPVGTVIKNLDNGKIYEVVKAGEKVMVARGGRGGRGNFHFRGPTNTSPKQFEEGRSGEEWNILLELQLIADAGLIGFPNAGKSSLLNELTRANVKVANFPFTTLEPNLGVFYLSEEAIKSKPELYGKYLILADIPGLIEGASKGRGLGYKFLRHIERTRELLHCISLESDDVLRDYEVIRKELGEYNPAMTLKDEAIILTKSDLVSKAELNRNKKILSSKSKNIIEVSIYDPDSMEQLKKFLGSLIAG